MLTKKIIFGIEFNSRSGFKPKYKIGLTAGWIRYRMSVFMKYTLQSLKKQTNQDFVALIQYADSTEDLINQELRKYEPLPENIQFLPRSSYQAKMMELITGFDYLFLVRLDCDDMYHKSMVQQLKNCNPKPNTQALINQNGYMYDAVRKRISPAHFKSPPFYTLIYKVEEFMQGRRYRTPGGHRSVIRMKHQILTSKGNRNFMIVIHKRNTLNQLLLRKKSFRKTPKTMEIVSEFRE